VEIYIDDFIGIAQPTTATHTLRTVPHSIDSVFWGEPLPHDKPTWKQVISQSKLDEGDGAWSRIKIILGWLLDTITGTLSLPPHKHTRLCHLLNYFCNNIGRTSRRKSYSLLEELQHMSIAPQGANYLFSILQSVLVDQPRTSQLRLSPLIHHDLHDWDHLVSTMLQHPIPISSLVPRAPNYVGAVDASGSGIGGFWLPTRHGVGPPTVFRCPLSSSFATELITRDNPNGKLTINDFELAALTLGTSLLAHSSPTPHSLVWFGSDKSSAVSWT